MAGQTPSQTIGPFFAYALTPEGYGREGLATNRLAGPDTHGKHIRIEGRLLDGDGAPVSDAMIEIWQANSHGRYRHPEDGRDDIQLTDGFSGFGRAMTDADGVFAFDTIKPGRVPGPGNTLQAPHVSVVVFARGMPCHAFTRIYFADEAEANAEDPVLGAVEESRRDTLIARRRDPAGGPVYHFDIRLQGPEETVFFDA